jgi:aminoglycoside 6'-N-acetyltransferase
VARPADSHLQLHGERVTLRPTTEGDAERLCEIHATESVATWWGEPEPEFPFSDDPEATRMTIVHEHEIAGLIQFSEELDPDYRHARIDIFVAPDLHNLGLGTDAVSTIVHHLIAGRGHHRITIDPAAANAAAIRCYKKAGFRPVGVMHRAARGPSGAWHDVLLMELLVPEHP